MHTDFLLLNKVHLFGSSAARKPGPLFLRVRRNNTLPKTAQTEIWQLPAPAQAQATAGPGFGCSFGIIAA
ncbi:hypothetical protein CFter6_4398 [Collimonas fungivorans]|uniref:Uncharacterized protein n=1 Tax=Collimonas fungivorans TaxID=158899 RepID=A0A127PGR2_9BURK|nr:hypothetical protein CFter6_4398 [Collimonas fungivorans]